jgi:hypothetical protein
VSIIATILGLLQQFFSVALDKKNINNLKPSRVSKTDFSLQIFEIQI